MLRLDAVGCCVAIASRALFDFGALRGDQLIAPAWRLRQVSDFLALACSKVL